MKDACTRPYDRAWLDYQHEIGLRHQRTKKNATDGADTVEIVPFRYLPVTMPPMALGLRECLTARDVTCEDAAALVDAWSKALALHVALWSRPYVLEADR